MSQPVPPEQPESTPAKSFRERLPRRPRLRRSRGVALGVAVVLVGGAAVGVAAVADHHHGQKGNRGQFATGQDREGGGDGEGRTRGEGRGGDGEHRTRGEGRGGDGSENDDSKAGADGQGSLAPAPVPVFSAAKAIEAAGKAVSGGKPDALRVVAQQGAGSAWEVEVLGADGVRHLVTLDGTTGAVTGNTVAPAAPATGR